MSCCAVPGTNVDPHQQRKDGEPDAQQHEGLVARIAARRDDVLDVLALVCPTRSAKNRDHSPTSLSGFLSAVDTV
jgi:hypothetical protein